MIVLNLTAYFPLKRRGCFTCSCQSLAVGMKRHWDESIIGDIHSLTDIFARNDKPEIQNVFWELQPENRLKHQFYLSFYFLLFTEECFKIMKYFKIRLTLFFYIIKTYFLQAVKKNEPLPFKNPKLIFNSTVTYSLRLCSSGEKLCEWWRFSRVSDVMRAFSLIRIFSISM